jgi:hypothetical protein
LDEKRLCGSQLAPKRDNPAVSSCGEAGAFEADTGSGVPFFVVFYRRAKGI